MPMLIFATYKESIHVTMFKYMPAILSFEKSSGKITSHPQTAMPDG
jgi:hypothetical protein